MKKYVASTALIVAVTGLFVFWEREAVASFGGFGGGAVGGAQSKALNETVVEGMKKYNGQTIKAIQITGLARTKERAVRWLMKTTEGVAFDSRQLATDIQALYNTDDIYDIHAQVISDSGGLTLQISVQDKWTLLPFAGAQGGGGSLTYGGGLYDTNLLGYFVSGFFNVYNYNGVTSYEINLYQEYVAGTQTMAYVDLSNTVTPVAIHNIDATSAGTYSWFRQQTEVMVGTHFDGPVRLMVIGDSYFDGMLNDTGVNGFTYGGQQYRLHPEVIFGRANIVDFLEDGHELTVHPSAANFFGPVTAYQSLDVNYKYVSIVKGEDNFAFNVHGAAMNLAPPPYEYQVGGYYNLRGYADSREVGPYQLVGSLEYRPMITKINLKFWGMDFDRVAVQGCVFSDAGSAWGDSTLTGDPGSAEFRPLWSAGFGFRFNFIHFAGAIMRLDFARTIHPDEGWGVSFAWGSFSKPRDLIPGSITNWSIGLNRLEPKIFWTFVHDAP